MKKADMEEIPGREGIFLARVRTELANRRTLLTYVKTALGFVISGIGLLHFNELSTPFGQVAIIAICVSPVILATGLADFHKTKKIIVRRKTFL